LHHKIRQMHDIANAAKQAEQAEQEMKSGSAAR
jgi:hypothetical protein